MFRILGIAVFTIVAAAWSVPAQGSPEGLWADEDNSFIIEVARCGERLCAEIVGLQPEDENKLDTKNTDRSKRDRPWCGLDVMGNLKPSTREPGKWEGGWIYNPEDGRTYSSEVRLDGANRLRVRGSVLGGLLGKNLNLYRAGAVTNRCREPAA
jgi:uncharacterized protein (DUF2147 family)